jgi:hypothetical protein
MPGLLKAVTIELTNYKLDFIVFGGVQIKQAGHQMGGRFLFFF